MPKEKKKDDRKKKAGKKSSQLAIRIEKNERDAFVELCERLDTSAAREIRRFMREFVAAHAASAEAPKAIAEETPTAAEEPAMPVKKPRASRKPRLAADADAKPAVEPPPKRRRKAATAGPAA
jgi:hypothetical protein